MRILLQYWDNMGRGLDPDTRRKTGNSNTEQFGLMFLSRVDCFSPHILNPMPARRGKGQKSKALN